jgi:hypothetical protein
MRMKQQPFASMRFEFTKKSTRRERFLGGDGSGRVMNCPSGADRSELPDILSSLSTAHASLYDVAHPFHAAVVRAERSGDGRYAV